MEQRNALGLRIRTERNKDVLVPKVDLEASDLAWPGEGVLEVDWSNV